MRRPLRFVLIIPIVLLVCSGALHLSEHLDLRVVPEATGVAHAQTPPPAAPRDCSPNGTVQFVCGLRAPEDLVALPGSQWIVASAFSGDGGLFLIRVSDKTVTQVYPSAPTAERLDAKTYASCPGPVNRTAKPLQTHGLYLLQGAASLHRLFVVGHGPRESVEVFEVDMRPQTPVFTWIGCAIAPEPVGLNSVRGLPDGGFVATNFLARGIDAASRTKMMNGDRNGELWEWHTASGWQKLPGSEASGANGLEISEDGRWFYVAAWGSQSFFRLSRGQGTPQRDEVPLGFRVDNIRWSRDGTLLATGQGGAPGAQATVIVKVDPQTMNVREVLRHPDSPAFRAGTVAVEIGNQLWVGSYTGDRLAVFTEDRR